MVKAQQTTKKTSAQSKESSYFSITLIPEKYQTAVFLAVTFFLIIIFFKGGLFEGKVFTSADNIASHSFDTFINDAKVKGEFPLWIPYIFCGMPSFASLIAHPERMYDWTNAVWIIVRNILYFVWGNNQVWQVTLYYIIFAFGFYFLIQYKFKDRLIAFFSSVASVFITPIIQFIIVGHNTKMIAIMMFPYVLLFIEMIYDILESSSVKKNIYRILLYFVGLIFCLHIQMSSNHIQMLFYFYFTIAIYLLYRIIYSLIKKSSIHSAVKITIIFILTLLLSAAMYADSYLSVKEYNKYSIRGVPSLSNQTSDNKNPEKNTEPLDYEYATNWSFSPGEIMTLIIPYWHGFGDVEFKGQRVNTYWGQMPFTTSPVYFGVITILLAFFGMYYNFRKSVLVQSLTFISLLSLFISFGRTFPLIYDFMFFHFPYFSSFRAPVMIHILINISFVILAAFGLKSLIDVAKNSSLASSFSSSAKYILPILFLPILFSIIGFKEHYEGLVISGPIAEKLQLQGANPQQIQQYVSQLASIAYDNVRSEILIIGVLLMLAFGACYYFINGKIRYQYFLPIICLLVLIDLWHIDNKTLHWDSKAEEEKMFQTPDYVDYILKREQDLNSFRVLEVRNDKPVTSNTLAYWRIQNAFGYQGAKLRILQDVADLATFNSSAVYKLANVKYIIADRPWVDLELVTVFKGTRVIWENKAFLPKTFFVSKYSVTTPFEMMDDLEYVRFDVTKEVKFETDPGIKIDPVDSTATAKITNYEDDYISIDAEATGNNLLFLSEVYYPAGWKAYVDGQETEIYKTNYMFRSIVVPKGKHKVEFKFEPEAYYTGKRISIGTNIVVILILSVSIIGIIIRKRNRNKEDKSDKK